jgi:hypothetical protein
VPFTTGGAIVTVNTYSLADTALVSATDGDSDAGLLDTTRSVEWTPDTLSENVTVNVRVRKDVSPPC